MRFLLLTFLKDIIKSLTSNGNISVNDNFKRTDSPDIKSVKEVKNSDIGNYKNNTTNINNITKNENHYNVDRELIEANKARKNLVHHLLQSYDGHSSTKHYENWIAMLLNDTQFSKKINATLQGTNLQNQFIASLISFVDYAIIKGIENGKQSFRRDWDNFIEQYKKIIPENYFNNFLLLHNEAIDTLKQSRLICYLNLDEPKKIILVSYLNQAYSDLQIKLPSDNFQPA